MWRIYEERAYKVLFFVNDIHSHSDNYYCAGSVAVEFFNSSDEDEREECEDEVMVETNVANEPNEDPEGADVEVKLSRGRKHFMTQELASALDKMRISSRDAVILLGATARALNVDFKELVLNRESIREKRRYFRELRYANFRKHFKFPESPFLVIHWDGKMLPSANCEEVERLAIIVSFNDDEQLLNVPETGGTGEDMAAAVYSAMEDWGICEKVVALCCDTTASNTGRLNGACVNLERYLDKFLIYLPCRHHIFETVLRGVFDAIMGPTSGPDTPLFKRFKESWTGMNRAEVTYGIDDESVKTALQDVRGEVLQFVNARLLENHFRTDYKEFLELIALFLNSDSSSMIKLRPPGPIHHARWMAKAIYCLKIFLFRNKFKLSKREMSNLRSICIFLVRIYVKAWFQAPFPIEAPFNDFLFLKSILEYKTINEKISRAAVKKFVRHLWYLSPEVISFSVFDSRIPVDVKRKMCAKIFEGLKTLETEDESDRENDSDNGDEDEQENMNEEEEETKRRVIVKPPEAQKLIDRGFHELIPDANIVLMVFEKLNMNYEFMREDPSTWPHNPLYEDCVMRLKKIRVVNDIAERAVKLISDYNNTITVEENQRQYLLQTVAQFRKEFPDANKSTLLAKSV
jgi:hypothetical protein